MTATPIVEILLLDARVSTTISESEQERQAEFKKNAGIREPDPQELGEEFDEFVKGFQEPETE
jgi:hypothetical protein